MPRSHSLIAARAPQLAADILQHPASLLLRASTVSALADLVARQPPSASPRECWLIGEAVGLIEAVEIALGRGARQ